MRQGREISCFIIFLGLVFASGGAVVFSAEHPQADQQRAKAADEIAARVNGEPIYAKQVSVVVEKNWGGSKKHGMRMENPDVLKELQRKALETIIDDELIAQESRKLKIDDIEERVAQKLKALETKYGAGEGVEKYLKRRSLTLEDYRKSARARVQVDEYLKRQGILEPEIPEDRIRRMYQDDPESFRREETVKVSHVLIAVDEHAGAETKEQARKKAEQIHAEIVQGKDFAEMARKHSNCNSASGGGDLGLIKKGYMPKEFEKAAFSLQKGAVSEVVETKFGYHIIKVIDKKPAGVAPYEDVRDFIRKYLQGDESRKRLASHVVELRKKSKIEILLK